MNASTRRNLWVLAGVLVLVALVAHHNIHSYEIILFCCIVPSIILHEVSHGYVANLFGDDTAKRAGRLTLNPVKHVDPVGTLIMPALLSLTSFGVFGWAKPVPVNTARLRSPRNHGVLVSLAGPATNAVLAAIAAVLFLKVLHPSGVLGTLDQVVFYFGLANVTLMVFNLLPIPPLDGSVLFERLLPARYWPTYLRIRPYTMPIIMGLVILNFYLNGHGPLTWLFERVDNWWASRMHVV
ncbi:MAG TPA: site-2 protease family protein [Acidimicrobiales bacterium]|jgi:Zn-dependent protease